ncbi:MAG: PAS domain S-box protein [Bacteroidales bacterium]|nr:PAS domain S-box protein [Bacteroidales bacterium]
MPEKGELQNKKWEDITFLNDIPESNAVALSLLEGKSSLVRHEKRYLRKNRGIVWTDISTYLRRDKENRPKSFSTTIYDITERKHAEEELTFRHLLEKPLNLTCVRRFKFTTLRQSGLTTPLFD